MRLGVEAAIVQGRLLRGDVEVEGGRIAAVGLTPTRGGGIAAPGFVDLQVNGYAGVDFASADAAGYATAGSALPASRMPRRASSRSRKNAPSTKNTIRATIAGR